MLENIEVFCHSSIKLNRDKVIYIDPFKIEKEYKDADMIFITHSHYDHYSEEDVKKVKKETTKICVTKDLYDKVIHLGFKDESIIVVEPNKKYKIDNIEFETIPSYNIGKQFHKKENKWVGYIITVNNIRYYIAGDTDITEENKQVKCDVAFIPIGGTYTMNSKEAAYLVNIIKPKVAIPVHYGSIVGSKEDEKDWIKQLNTNIEYRILI